MKILVRFFLLVPSALLLVCVLVVFFGISNTPELRVGWTLSRNDVSRAKQILHEGSKTKPDALSTIELSQADLNLAANYLLNRYNKGAAKIEIRDQVLRFVVTMSLPPNLLGHYVNISFRLGKEDPNQLLSLTKFKAGKLLLPAKFASFIINTVIHQTSLREYFILETPLIKDIKIAPQKIIISYYSTVETLIQAREFLTRGDANPELIVYQKKLAEIVQLHDSTWRLSLAELLKPMFALAYQRSTLETAVEENKTLIMAVNFYVNGQEAHKFLATGSLKPIEGKHYATFLYKRADLAQHFIASAAITTAINSQIAQAIGEEKELSDTQEGGSGFSFVDLAADKAGTKLGEVAVASPESARKLQKALSEINDYSDFMPDPTDLPEHMNAAAFKQRYQSITSPAYQALSKEIDDRISVLPIYKGETKP